VGDSAFGVVNMRQRAYPPEQGGFVRSANPGFESGLSTKPGPALVALEDNA
jgi:hypothetical protein